MPGNSLAKSRMSQLSDHDGEVTGDEAELAPEPPDDTALLDLAIASLTSFDIGRYAGFLYKRNSPPMVASCTHML